MTDLPEIPLRRFRQEIERLSPEPLGDATVVALHAHYLELRRWAPRLALIGPGTADRVLERHFGESLAALPLIPSTPPLSGQLLDVGSGAGFPGLVLAAARPHWQATLVEARQRKWAFLLAAARRAALSCRCLDARVGDPLPGSVPDRYDLLTARAIRFPVGDLAVLLERLTPAGRALLWVGEADPELPRGYAARTAVELRGSERRRILEVRAEPR